jgi:hypothetical protein
LGVDIEEEEFIGPAYQETRRGSPSTMSENEQG